LEHPFGVPAVFGFNLEFRENAVPFRVVAALATISAMAAVIGLQGRQRRVPHDGGGPAKTCSCAQLHFDTLPELVAVISDFAEEEARVEVLPVPTGYHDY
jgi:hypothetical protein